MPLQTARPPTRPGLPVLLLGILAILGWAVPLFVPSLQAQVASLRLTQATWGHGELWALLTHLVFPPQFLTLFFDLVMLYFFAPDTRRHLGSAKWMGMIALATLLGGAGGALGLTLLSSDVAIGGLHAPIAAMLTVYCITHWRVPMSLLGLQLDGKRLFLLFLGIDLAFSLLGGAPALFLHAAGGALAGGFFALGLHDLKRLRSTYSYWRVRRNLKVISSRPEDHPRAPDRKLKQQRDGRKRDDGTWLN